MRLFFPFIFIMALLVGCQKSPTNVSQYCTLSGEAPLIIAHRGASGELPEHTLAAYQRAIEQGAGFIEPDLVITKDGHLIARHGRALASTTNVADHPEFADRKKYDHTHSETEDWYAEDFTLAEIKSLRAMQYWDNRPLEYDGLYEIPTFEEIMDLVQTQSKLLDRRIGVYPETKDPHVYDHMGRSFDEPLLATLEANGYNDANDPVFIQSFHPAILERLSQITEIRLVFLISEVNDKSVFMEIANVVDGVGPPKESLLDEKLQSTGFVEAAHAAGLFVHPWTFRDDGVDKRFSNKYSEAQRYFDLGIDGGFFDYPASGVKALSDYKGCPRD